ncbi:MAG: efflux RND transporter permease subunit [Elusimicrobia bacterium]|nr:efflux RND transporter permease subunit [Elusimicrobiota bacterium]
MERFIDFILKWRALVIAAAVLAALVGWVALKNLPIDAVPDVTNVQVQVLTNSPGLGPLEVERLITFPVESAMSGIPKVTQIRSLSKFGLSAVTVIFQDGTDIYWARQLISERIEHAKDEIPEGLGHPEMAPISSGLGEILQFEVMGKGYSLMELRSLLEWEIAPRLKSIPGVVEVNAFGGELKTYEVQIEPKKLISLRISLSQVFEALEKNNANAGGAYIEKNQEQYLIRGEGLVERLDDVASIIVAASKDGFPIYVRDLGSVALAPMVRQGAVTRDGRGEAVTGIVMMLLGENSRTVVERVKEKIDEIALALPPGVIIDTFYDRAELVDRTVITVVRNLIEGGLLVIGVLFLTLGSLKAGLVVASVIPLAMLIAFTAMLYAGVSGNLMSLGAVDFGLLVDGAVVLVENAVRRLAQRQVEKTGILTLAERISVMRESFLDVARPVIFGVGIIATVYLPILSLEGIEGRMFRPMAMTVIFALVAALILTLTFVPVVSALFLYSHIKESDTILVERSKLLYRPVLGWTLLYPKRTLGIAGALFLASAGLFFSLGFEFIPKLDEGAIALQAWRLPSVSLNQSLDNTTKIEGVLREFPEVISVVSKTGRAEIATDPMGIEISDIIVNLTPRSEWMTAKNKESLIAAMDKRLKERVIGAVFSYSQPIELRVSELIAGVRSDAAVKIFGDDLDELKALAQRVVRAVSSVRGASDVKAEQISGLPVLRVRIDRQRIARYGINAADVLSVVEAMGGKVLGQVLEGQRRYYLQARFANAADMRIEDFVNIPVADPSGRMIPLGQLADIIAEEGPAQVSRENLRRRVSVEINVRGRDLGGFVAEAREVVAETVELPPGYYIEWGGQFEHLERAGRRLLVATPVALGLIFLLLYLAFGSARPAAFIYLNIPLAATGGVLALFLRGMPFSISAGVGFIALFGIAVLNGVVMVSYIRQLRQEGLGLEESIIEGAMIRFRPVLMTALAASFGFLPMAISSSAGAEVQRPLATVVIGGLVSSTLLTLVVMPAVYKLFDVKVETEREIEI